VDIGGGSVEFIIGNKSEILWKESFEIGAQRLLEEFHKHDPITSDEVEAMHLHFSDVLKPLFAALNQHKPGTLVGSSGTFDTLSDIYCIKKGVLKEQGDSETPLTFAGFYEIYEELLAKDRAARMQIPGMIELRVDMIVVACSLIDFLLSQYTNFKQVRVSSYALKEGVLAELMETTYKP
ncbi:MAG: exopolyphosphatase, partial [Cyclobacteriaceae bacterium]